MKMRLYDCKVGMRASDGPVVIHEARRLGCTAPEILVLQNIHGEDLVTEIKPSNMKRDFQKKNERDRLCTLYGERMVIETLGPKAAKLPDELEVDSAVEPEAEEIDPVIETKRGPKARASG